MCRIPNDVVAWDQQLLTASLHQVVDEVCYFVVDQNIHVHVIQEATVWNYQKKYMFEKLDF